MEDDVLQSLTKPEDESVDQMVARLGLKTNTEPQKVKFKPEDIQFIQDSEVQQPQPGVQPAKVTAPKAGQGAQDLAKGIGQGLGLAAQNIYNGAQDIINGIANYATFSKGETSGDIIPSSAKLDVPAFKVPEGASMEQKAGALLGQYGAPVVATMGVGASALSATAVGAGVDFLTLDPHQERLSTLLLEEYPEMRNIAVFGNMMQWMAERDPSKESELEGRFKNTLEGIGIGGAVAGAFRGISKMTSSAKAYIKGAPEAASDAAKIIPPKAPLEEAELTAIEARMGANLEEGQIVDVRPMAPDEKAAFDALDDAGKAKVASESATARVEVKEAPPIVNPNAGYKGADNLPRTNVHSEIFDNLLLFADNSEVGYVSRSFDDLKYQARLMGMSSDKEDVLAKILDRKAGDAPFSPEETTFIAKELLPRFKQETMAAMKALRDADASSADSALLMLSFENAKARQFKLAQLVDGSASEAGATLNAQKMLYEISGVREASKATQVVENGAVKTKTTLAAGTYEFLRNADAKGKLHTELLQKLGGIENIKEYQTQLKAIDAYLEGLPVGEAEKTYELIQQATKNGYTKKAMQEINTLLRMNMLASPKSATGAWLGNMMTTFTSAADEFTKAGVQAAGEFGVPGFKRFVVTDKAAKVAFMEANDYAAGLMQGFAANIKGIRDTWKFASRQGQYIRVDLRSEPLDPRNWGIDPWSVTGKMMEKTGAVISNTLGFGQKLVGTADAFWGSSIEHAKLHQFAMMKARKAVADGVVENNPEKITQFVQDAIRNSSVEEVQQAQKFGKELVFAQEVSQVEGDKLANVIGEGTNFLAGGPLRQIISPFLRTKYNMIDYGMQHSILGPIWRQTSVGQAIARGGEEGAMATAKVLNGTMFTGAMAYLAYNGLVTGAPPDNPRMLRALQESNKGWQPYSFKIGDTYVSYRTLEPMATMLKMGWGAFTVANHADERDAGATMNLMGAALADTFSPQNLAEGAATIFDAVNDMARYKDDPYSFQKLMQDQFGKLNNNLLRDIKRYQDPFRRDTAGDTVWQGIQNAFISKTPGWSNDDLSVQRNMWGEPMLEPEMLGPDIAMPLPTSDATKGSKVREVLDLFARHEIGKPQSDQLMKLAFQMPSRTLTFEGMDIRLTNEEYERYVLYTAGYMPDDKAVPGKEKAFREPLKNVVERNALQVYSLLKGKEVPPVLYNSFMKEIQKTVTGYRKTAKDLLSADPVFRERLQKARMKRMELQNVGF